MATDNDSDHDERIFIKGEPLPVTPRYANTNAQLYSYAGKLYPHEAINVLRCEAEGVPADQNLDDLLGGWLRAHVSDPHTYLKELFNAIDLRQCTAGLCARLNLACLTGPSTDTISIATAKGGTTRVSRLRPSLDWIPQSAHFLVRQSCKRAGHPFSDKASFVAERVEQLTNSYDMEQILLVRIAYLAVHSRLKDQKTIPALRALTYKNSDN